jgi:hypothetical protein
VERAELLIATTQKAQEVKPGIREHFRPLIIHSAKISLLKASNTVKLKAMK